MSFVLGDVTRFEPRQTPDFQPLIQALTGIEDRQKREEDEKLWGEYSEMVFGDREYDPTLESKAMSKDWQRAYGIRRISEETAEARRIARGEIIEEPLAPLILTEEDYHRSMMGEGRPLTGRGLDVMFGERGAERDLTPIQERAAAIENRIAETGEMPSANDIMILDIASGRRPALPKGLDDPEMSDRDKAKIQQGIEMAVSGQEMRAGRLLPIESTGEFTQVLAGLGIHSGMNAWRGLIDLYEQNHPEREVTITRKGDITEGRGGFGSRREARRLPADDPIRTTIEALTGIPMEAPETMEQAARPTERPAEEETGMLPPEVQEMVTKALRDGIDRERVAQRVRDVYGINIVWSD